jgi:hypothetical protein
MDRRHFSELMLWGGADGLVNYFAAAHTRIICSVFIYLFILRNIVQIRLHRAYLI